MCLPKKGSCFKSRSECVIKEFSICCCNEDGETKSHVKNVVIVSRGLKRETGGVGEQSNVMKSDEYTKDISE